jgi:hypothetical protein
MPWTIQLLDAPKAVCVQACGAMKLVLIRQIAGEALAVAASHGVRQFLVDNREMEPQLSTLEVHELPDMLEHMGLGRRDRAAVVYTKSAPKAEDFRFFETTAINRGFSIRLFTDLDQAITWLRSAS